jgi:hypothetical protein
MVLIGGPITTVVVIMHNSYVQQSINEGRIKVVGTVTELFVRSGKNSQTQYAIFTYQVHNKTWKQITVNRNSLLSLGDTISLICSDKDPEVFMLLPN